MSAVQTELSADVDTQQARELIDGALDAAQRRLDAALVELGADYWRLSLQAQAIADAVPPAPRKLYAATAGRLCGEALRLLVDLGEALGDEAATAMRERYALSPLEVAA